MLRRSTKLTTAEKQKLEVLAWYVGVKSDFSAVATAITGVDTAAGADTTTVLGTACSTLTSAVQTLQADPPAPVTAINTPLQGALTSYATGGSLCSSAASRGTSTLIDEAIADFTTAKSGLAQAIAQMKQINSELP